MAVASRCPYRECLRAASWRRSTSFGVRYSRSRRSALRGRRGVTVRFTMVEGVRVTLEFFTGNTLYRKEAVRIMYFLRRVINFRPGPSRRNFVARHPPFGERNVMECPHDRIGL